MPFLGINFSVNTAETLTKNILEVVKESVSNTSQSAAVSQTLNISGNTGSNISGVKLLQNVSLSASSTQTTSSMNTLLNDIAAKLTGTITQDQDGFGIGNTNVSVVKTKVTNIVQNSITAKTISDCVNMANAKQELNITNNSDSTIEDITLDQTLEMFAECYQTSDDVTEAVNNIKTELNLSSEQTSTTSWTVIIVIIAVICIIGGVMWWCGWKSVLGIPYNIANKMDAAWGTPSTVVTTVSPTPAVPTVVSPTPSITQTPAPIIAPVV